MAAVFVTLSLLYCYPVFVDFTYWGIQDWDSTLSHYELARRSFLTDHQFPLWNPYSFGGMPFLADIESNFLQPGFLLILIFGTVAGAKLMIPLHVFIALTGMYALAGRFGMTPVPRFLSACVYGMSGMVAVTLTSGMMAFHSVAYLPWIFYVALRSHTSPRFSIGTGALLALVFLAGGTNLFVYGVMMTVLIHLLAIPRIGWRKATRILGLALLLASLFAAVKLLPSVEFFTAFPRHDTGIHLEDGYSLEGFSRMLISRDQRLSALGNYYSSADGFWRGMDWFMDENGMYVGVIPVILCLIGLAVYFRRQWQLSVLLLIFIWLSFGFRSPVSLWQLLHELPFFDSMRCAMRFRTVFLIPLALFAGLGLQHLAGITSEKTKRTRLVHGTTVCLAVMICLDLIAVGQPIWREAFQIPPMHLKRDSHFLAVVAGIPAESTAMNLSIDPPLAAATVEPPFMQISRLPLYTTAGYEPLLSGAMTRTEYDAMWKEAESALWRGDDYLPWSLLAQYPAQLTNLGTVATPNPSIGAVPRHAVPADNPTYRGEVFLLQNHGTATVTTWSPNRLTIEIDADAPDTVVVNQNYYRGWRVAGKAAKAENGLIAADIGAGRQQVTFYYRPWSFIIGALLSVASVIGTALFLYLRRGARQRPDGLHSQA